MKRILITVPILIVTLICSCTMTDVVGVRPGAPLAVTVRPGIPGPGYIWIEDYWVWNPQLRVYAWHEGYWSVPRLGYAWIRGGWIGYHGGWRWSPGHWRRGR